AAIRMSEAMLFAAPAPGALAPRGPMDGGMTANSAAPQDAPSGAMDGAMSGSRATVSQTSLPPRDAPPVGAPVVLGQDAAWVAELKERHVALERAAEEAVKSAERRVLDAHYEM